LGFGAGSVEEKKGGLKRRLAGRSRGASPEKTDNEVDIMVIMM